LLTTLLLRVVAGVVETQTVEHLAAVAVQAVIAQALAFLLP
jgi:hypothetical protein